MRKIFNIIIFLSFLPSVSALVPLESIMLGDLSKQYFKDDDPVSYIYEEKKAKKGEKLSNYIAFADEGYNLLNYCENNTKINYIDNWSKQQVKRSLISTLQYVGLDITTRALAEYAKFFEFEKNEFENMVDGLVGNYCSQNLSVISIKQLKANFKKFYDLDQAKVLPSVENDDNFPRALWQTTTESNSKRQEMSITIDLFKSFCSWGNDVDNLRLLVPFIKDPMIMSFVNRQMSGYDFKFEKGRTKLKKSNKTVSVFCENLICRKKSVKELYKRVKLSLGSQSYRDDFNRLYCTDFKNVDFQYKGQVPEILKIIRSMTFDDQNAQAGQLISLLTGVPDFMNRVEKYTVMKEVLKSSMNQVWNNWADQQIKNYQNNLHYEERLLLKVVNRTTFFNEYLPEFEVNIDVTLGELDNSIAMNDKIKSSFSISVSKKFLAWARENWRDVDINNEEEMKKVLKPFTLIIKDQVENAREQFEIPPWKSGLERIVAIEVLEQISRYIGNYFENPTGMMKIPVNLNYGVFALRYTHERWKISQESGGRTKRIKKLEDLLPGR